MKRIFSILLVLLLALSVLTGCAQVEGLIDKLPFIGEKACTHDYEVVVTEPTCEAAGFTTKTCKLCENVETVDPTEALGHNYADGVCTVCKAEDPNYVPPHEHNFVEGKCECGVEDPNYVPPHVHAHEAVVTAPNCTEAGFTTYTCACGDSYVADEVEALGHTWVNPTCEADGYCSVCNAKGADALGHNYVDHVCAACGKDDPDHYFEMSIVDALAAVDGKKVSVSGTVSVAGSWNSNFGNMNATIVDADGNELYLYRLSTEVKLGDIITVSGVMATYNGNRQMAQGATAVITGHDSSYDVVNEYTIPEALELPDNTNIIVIGTVVEINGEWNDNFGNMNVTIADEEGNTLYVYRLATKVALNDIIKIKGAMGTYKEERQVAEGATAEIIGTAPSCEHVWVAPTCTEAGYCSECGAEGETALGHTADVDAAVAATCTSTGLTEGSHCSVCDEILVAQVETAIVDHSYVSGSCSMCGKLVGEGTETDPYVIPMPGDYVAAFPGGYDLVFYQMTNNRSGGYYTLSSTMGAGAWLKIGTNVYTLTSNDGTGDSLTVYVPQGVTCYFGVADWNEAANDIPFTVSFEAFVSEPVDHFVGSWAGEHKAMWGSSEFVFNINENGLGTIEEDVGYATVVYDITLVIVNGNKVSIYSVDEYDNAFNFELVYDADSNSLSGSTNYGTIVLTPYVPSEGPETNYETVIILGNNVIFISAEELAADIANRTVVITEDGTYQFSAPCLFVSKLIAADGTEYSINVGRYTVPAGEYTAVFTNLSMFGAQADVAYDLIFEIPADIGGGEGGEGGEGGDDDGEGEYIDPYDTLKDSLYGFYTVDGYELFLFYSGTVGIYYANVYGDGYDLYFTYEVTEIEEGVYALTLALADHDNNYGLENVDAILNCEFVISKTEDDTPDFITDLMESISGSYEFDDYCVLIYPDYDREMYIANVYGDSFDLYFTFEAVDLGDGTYALMLEYLPVDWETGSEMVDTILDLSIVVAPQSEDDTPDFMESISGNHEFDDYCVLIYPSYDLGIYVANIYGAIDGVDFDLYFTFEAVDLGDGTYALMLEYLPVDYETGSEMVNTILDLSIVVAPQEIVEPDPEEPVDYNYLLNGTYEFKPEEGVSFVVKFEDGIIYVIEDTMGLGLSASFYYTYNPMTGMIMTDEGYFYTDGDLNLYYGRGWLLSPVVEINTDLDGTYEFKPEEGASFVVKLENGVIYVIEDTLGLGLSASFNYSYNPMTGVITSDEGYFFVMDDQLYFGRGWLLSPVTGEEPVTPEIPANPNLSIGENTINVNDTWNGDAYDFIATEDGTYNFIVGTNGFLIVEGPYGADIYFEGDMYTVECVAGDVITVRVATASRDNNVAVINVELASDVHTHKIVYVPAVEAVCHQNGSYEYWYCTECEAVYADEALTQLTNRKNLTIPYIAEIVHVEAVEAACHQNGCAEYWYCSECDAVFADAALTQLTNRKNLTIPYTAEIIHEDAVAVTCTENGMLEFWYCAECNALFTDAALTQLSNYKSCVVPAPGHVWVDPTCAEAGYCSVCNAEGEAATGEHTWVDPTCTADGYCSVCEAEGEAALGHTAGAEATCTTAQICTVCEVELVAALGHKYGAWEPMGDATYGRTCANDASHVETLATADLLAQFYALAKDTAYSGTVVLEGVIDSIDEAYSTQYKNITVSIIVDGYNNYIIKCYRLKGDAAEFLSVGDTIKVSGNIKNYNGIIEFDTGCTILNHVAHECDFAAATCEDPATCVICYKTTGDLGDHNYVDGTCSVCGHTEGAAEIVKETATLAYTTATTTNMTGNNDAATLGLDAAIFSVVGNKGGTNNNCGLNKSGQIRLYGSSSNGNGSYFTVTIAEGYVIESIKITFTNTTNNKNCQLTVGEDSTVFDGSAKIWEADINSDSFELKNVITGATTQIYIASIEITYYAV